MTSTAIGTAAALLVGLVAIGAIGAFRGGSLLELGGLVVAAVLIVAVVMLTRQRGRDDEGSRADL